MGNTFTFYSFLALLGCLLTGLFFAWLLYGKPSMLSKRMRLVLAGCRAITVALILWLLFSPLIKQVNYTLEKPIVIIAQDNSESVGNYKPVGFDRSVYKGSVLKLSKRLSEKYDVRTYHFSDKVSKSLDFSYNGKLSNATLLFNQLNDEFINRNVGAVILASDGIFNRGGSPAEEAISLKAPLHIIALGDTVPKKDVLIANVNSNDLVYLDNDFTIEIQAEAYQSKGEQSRLSVLEDGKKVYESTLKFTTSVYTKNIPVPLKASRLGQHTYTITLSTLTNEVSLKNNSQQVTIEVIDDRQKVLIAAAGPHPDLAALRQSIMLNKHYDVSVLMNDALHRIEPKAYGLVILYQLPSITYPNTSFITKLKAAQVPVWWIVGAQTDLNQFNQAQTGLLSTGGGTALRYAYSDISPNLSVFDLDAAARKVIEDFEPLQVPATTFKTPANVQSVLNHRFGQLKSGSPQLFFRDDNGRKTGYLLGEGIWKWKLSEAKNGASSPVFNLLISKVMQYLSVKDNKRKFVVYPAATLLEENQRVILNATLYNDSYIAQNTPDVDILLKDGAGKTYNFTFSRFESSYQLDAGILPAGTYSYVANTQLGTQRYSAKGTFMIKPLVAEYQQTIANHQLLGHLAAQTNGKLYFPNQLAQLEEQLLYKEQLKTLSYEDRKYEELINLKWLFALILFLMSTEWFLRKRNSAP
jgi:hypothetical protein